MITNTYKVEKNFPGLDCCDLSEPEINHLASEYIVDNLAAITNQAYKMVGVDPNKAEDLVQDLIESVLKSEACGEGYDISHSNAGSVITVAEFVYGRMKLYSKNRKYQMGACESHTSTRRVGNQSKSVTDFEVLSASTMGDTDYDSMSSVQRAYASAHSYDNDIDTVDTMVSLRQDISFCCEFNEVVGFDFMRMFKNIEIFASSAFEDSLFDRLRKALKIHDELRDALHNVLMASATDRSAFELVLAEVG